LAVNAGSDTGHAFASSARKEDAMVGKGLRFLVPAALALLVAAQWQDIIRYVKISQLSTGQGHPENVPARGRASYPQRPGSGEADGHGDFDSASRGGPRLAQ
jgi:hypothetical protein